MCDHCGKSFKSKQALKKHQGHCNVPMSERKKYFCKICGRCLMSVFSLTEHQKKCARKTTEVKAIKCAHCEFASESGKQMLEHLSKTGTTTTTCYYFLFKTYGSTISTMSHKGKEIPLLQSLFKYNTQEYHYVIKKLVVQWMLKNHKMPSPPHHFMHYSFIFIMQGAIIFTFYDKLQLTYVMAFAKRDYVDYSTME